MRSIQSILNKQLLVALILLGVITAGILLFVRPTYALPTSCNDAQNEVLWCGAATTQQVVSDYYNGDGHNSAASIQNIFSYFGISSADINALPQDAVAGVVTKSGNVIVNGNIVATQAVTGGRQYIPGSNQATLGGTTFFVRPPSVSFLSNSLDAFVVMINGRFAFAILSSCGNAIEAKPVAPPPPPPPAPTPTASNYTIQKQVSQLNTNQWSSEVEVHPNTKVDYRVIVSSTGSANVTNLIVTDTLPNDDTYDQGTLMLNGQAMNTADASSFFDTGYSIGTLAPNAVDTFQFEATAGANQNNANCTNETLPNVASMQATNLPNESATATVSVVCIPPTPTPPPTVTQTSTPPAPTPTPPQQLVNTGPGNILGAVIGFGVAGGAGYSLFLRRKLALSVDKS